MKRSAIYLVGSSLLWMLCGAAAARADFVTFQYQWSNSPPGGVSASSGSGGSKIHFVDGGMQTSSPVPVNSLVATSINAPMLFTTSNAKDTSPDSFNGRQYSITIAIFDPSDPTPGTPKELTFSGFFDGKLSKTISTLKNTPSFDPSDPTFDPTTQSIDIGNLIYTIQIVTYPKPGSPIDPSVNFVAVVTIQEITPEPSSVLLSCLGVSFLGLASWRKRRWK